MGLKLDKKSDKKAVKSSSKIDKKAEKKVDKKAVKAPVSAKDIIAKASVCALLSSYINPMTYFYAESRKRLRLQSSHPQKPFLPILTLMSLRMRNQHRN